MSLFRKKKNQGHYSVPADHYVPSPLPTVEPSLENFVTSDYPINRREILEEAYADLEKQLNGVIDTCDAHCDGSECDHLIATQIEHERALMDATDANNANQITRIRSARAMRRAALDRRIAPLQERAERLKKEIDAKEDLRAQFQLNIGKHAIGIGLLVTLMSVAVDTVVNYSFMQKVVLDNLFLLWVTVIGMAVMSDCSMWALGTFLSRRDENFTSKPLYWTVCTGLFSMFLISVAASVMVRWGSMAAVFGSIGADGEYIGKESYTLAEYGLTLATSFLTTATGILSFAFSLDKNANAIAIRERQRKELKQINAELDVLLDERALIDGAPDPEEWNRQKREAGERQLETLEKGLQLHYRKLQAVRRNDPDFTDKMAQSGRELLEEAPAEQAGAASISLDKVC